MHNIILLIFVLFVACSKNTDTQYDQSYPFTGIIIKKFEDKKQMLIDHEAVPGFMDKMVMMFNIDSTVDIKKYNIGDSLNFNFYILHQKDGPSKTWANELKIVGHRQLTEEESYDDFFNVIMNGRGEAEGAQKGNVMPAFGANTNVAPHVEDMYRYAKARAEGKIRRGVRLPKLPKFKEE